MRRYISHRDIALTALSLLLFISACGAVAALDKPEEAPQEIVYAMATPEPLVFAPVADEPEAQEDVFRNHTPLSDDLYTVLLEACEANAVPVPLALAIMEQESRFDQDAVSPSGCYGLMQLNPKYFPADLTPAENIQAGVGYLGELLEAYSTTPQAVTAYFYGPSERTSSWYSDEVLDRVEKWRETTQ